MVYKHRPVNFQPRFKIVSCYIEFNGKFLVMKRNQAKLKGGTWDKPAGKVENESLRKATIREIGEETGIQIKSKDLFSHKRVFVRYPEYDYIFHMFKTQFDKKPVIYLNAEHTEYKWVTPLEAIKMNLIPDEDTCVKLFYNLT